MREFDIAAGSWPQVQARLEPLVRRMVTAPDAFLGVHCSTTDRYVQFHGEPDGYGYAEADSGYYRGSFLTRRKHRVSQTQDAQLRALGWLPPMRGVDHRGERNYRYEWPPPADVPGMVALAVRTLAQVYGAEPNRLTAQGELPSS